MVAALTRHGFSIKSDLPFVDEVNKRAFEMLTSIVPPLKMHPAIIRNWDNSPEKSIIAWPVPKKGPLLRMMSTQKEGNVIEILAEKYDEDAKLVSTAEIKFILFQ